MNSNKIKHDVNDEEEDCEFEVITINPNQNYESDEEPMEDLSHTESSEKVEIPKEEQICPIREVNLKVVEAEDKTEETCDNIEAIVEDDNSMNSNDSMKKVRKKLNLQEYKMRRANEKPQPLFDLPRKIAAFELCDVPASLPNLVLPTDPKWISSNHKEIKKESTMLATSSRPLFNPAVYEEIIMVSNGCNTEITISPNDESDENQQSGSKFLKNIVNNLKKENIENVLNSSTSLFSSIQAVVQKRCASTETKSENTCDTSTESNNQGEDKVIMHLRKDRLRPFKCSVGLQTEDMTLFPPLLLSPSLVFNRIRNSRSYRRKNSRSRSRSRSFSPSMKYKRVRYHSGRYSRSQHSTHSSSMNSSDSSSSSESDSDSSDYSSSQSSSESLQHFNDRENFRFYNRNQNETQGFTYQGKLFVTLCIQREKLKTF